MITKVKDIPYTRYTLEMGKAAFAAFESAIADAKCHRCVLSAREKFLEEIGHYETSASLSFCRYTLNTKDEFYKGEMDYYDTVGPEFNELLTKYADIMLNSPFRAELEKTLNKRIFTSFEVQKKAFSADTIEECKRENALVTEYSALMSGMLFEYQGKEYPLASIRGYLSSADREVRRTACEAIGKGLEKNAKELDRIYDELVKVRTEIARKMGYKSFTELGYYRMGRMDYDRDMVERFRNNVKHSLVDLISKLKAELKDELSLDKIMFYDNDTYSIGASPDPVVDAQGIFNAGKEMYDDMSPITADFMHRMLEAEAFDTEAREGKWGGGYCTAFRDYKQPFILANFNGTSGDVDVMTHEFGHALASDFSFKEGDRELSIGGMETAECHSMSMEFFAWKYADKFFGPLTKAYKKKHLLSALSFIPYGVAVDEFQHEVYENPDMTPEDRKALWRSLEAKYRPYLSYEGIPYLEQGTRWQYQMHIYESPFYYIDYCLAQTVAFGFLVKSREDYEGAFNDYISFVRKGGQKAFDELIKDAGIASPFEDGALDNMAKKILEIAKELK